MDEQTLKAEFRLVAIEQVIRLLLAKTLSKETNGSLVEAKKLLDGMIEKAASDTTPEAHPAQSDMIAAEYEEAMRSLLDGVLTILQEGQQRWDNEMRGSRV